MTMGRLSAVGNTVRLLLGHNSTGGGGGGASESILPDYQWTLDGHTTTSTRYQVETMVQAAFIVIPDHPQARGASNRANHASP